MLPFSKDVIAITVRKIVTRCFLCRPRGDFGDIERYTLCSILAFEHQHKHPLTSGYCLCCNKRTARAKPCPDQSEFFEAVRFLAAQLPGNKYSVLCEQCWRRFMTFSDVCLAQTRLDRIEIALVWLAGEVIPLKKISIRRPRNIPPIPTLVKQVISGAPRGYPEDGKYWFEVSMSHGLSFDEARLKFSFDIELQQAVLSMYDVACIAAIVDELEQTQKLLDHKAAKKAERQVRRDSVAAWKIKRQNGYMPNPGITFNKRKPSRSRYAKHDTNCHCSICRSR